MGEICGIFNYSSHYPCDNRQDDKQERLIKGTPIILDRCSKTFF